MFLYLLAALFSAWLGRVELHTDDTGIEVGLMVIGAFLLGVCAPRRPWVWGLIVPFGIIAVARDPGVAAFTIGVATAAAYLGALIRSTVRSREAL